MKQLLSTLFISLALSPAHADSDTPPTLVINELMASNAGIVMSPAINFDSWIEVYNPTEQAIDLGGMYLSDHADNPKRWQMPRNMGTVPAKGFKVVWLGSDDIKSNQATFHLDCDGGIICLSDANGQLITSQVYPAALSRTAWARKTDGGEEWGWTAMPTPNATNATAVFATERLDAPVVDTGSRLFNSSFSVLVEIPDGTTLRYTTDGSLPQANSNISTTGKFTISKTTSLCVRLFRDGYLPSVPVTRSYIKTSNHYTLPIISIVGDRKFFTDPKIGFDCDGDGTNGKTGNGQDWPRNYNQDWDRPVNFSYISPEGEMRFNQDVNISASGGWTRSQRFRSFKLKSNKIFDGQNRFDYTFFPQKPYIRNKVLLVRNGGNDVWTHNARFMDPALETIIQRSGLDVDVQSYVPVIEYVNGELRGVLNLREPNNDKFADANWGYDDEELDAFENLVMKNGDDEAINRIFELGRQATDSAAYAELKTLLDIDEFTNYMAVTMFLDNDDWPNNNIKGYRSRLNGRYRFVSFDLDYAFALRNFNKNNDNPFTYFLQFKDADMVQGEANINREIVRLLLNLLGREDYRRQFIDTFCLVAGSVFEPTRAGKIVDELLARVKPMCQLMMQQGIYDGHDPDRAASTIKNKLRGRSQKMTNYLRNFSYARLSDAAQSVTLNADTEGARLFVNGIAVPYADFKGHLFAPVTLRAEPPAGYQFAGWKKGGVMVGSDREMALPAGIVGLTACFTPLTDDEKKARGISPVRINELSADNGIYANDYFKRNDWVELYNTTDADIDVEGMYLSDNVKKPTKYQITKGDTQAQTVIPAHGYLMIWCDKLAPQSQLHATFKLGAEGGDVLLTAQDESWSDHISYPVMAADQTVGRYPDGGNSVYLMNVPTIAKTNILSSYAVDITKGDPTGISLLAVGSSGHLSVQYADGSLIIRGTASQPAVRIDLCTIAGQLLGRQTVSLANGYARQSLSPLSAGCYIARLTDGNGHTAICKFIKQ